MKLCPQCLISYGDDRKFCSECGTALVEDPDGKTVEPAEIPAEPEKEAAPELPAEKPEEQAAVEPEAEEPEKKEPEPEKPIKPSKKELREAQKEERRREKEAREAARRAPIGVGRRIAAILLSVLLFVLALAGTLAAELRIATGADGMKAALEEIDLGSVRIDPFFDDVEDEMTLSQLLSEDLTELGYPIGEKTVTKLLRSSTIKNYLAKQISGVFADIYSGRSRYEYEPEELAEELTSSKLAKTLDREHIELTEADAKEIAELIDSYGAGEFLNMEEIRDEYPAVYRGLHFGLSTFTLGGVLLMMLLLIGLIFKANKGRAGLSFGDIGGALIFAGAIPGIAGLMAKLLPDLWQSLCMDEALAAQATGAVLFSNWRISLAVFGAGLLLAVLGRLLRGHRRPKEAAPAKA